MAASVLNRRSCVGRTNKIQLGPGPTGPEPMGPLIISVFSPASDFCFSQAFVRRFKSGAAILYHYPIILLWPIILLYYYPIVHGRKNAHHGLDTSRQNFRVAGCLTEAYSDAHGPK